MKKLIAWINSWFTTKPVKRLVLMGTPAHGVTTTVSMDPPVAIIAPEKPEPVQKPIKSGPHKGCYTYSFDRNGNCYMGPATEPVIFTCIATNLSNATRKYRKFITLNPPADDAGDRVPEGAFAD
jgi:hypothetical protein